MCNVLLDFVALPGREGHMFKVQEGPEVSVVRSRETSHNTRVLSDGDRFNYRCWKRSYLSTLGLNLFIR